MFPEELTVIAWFQDSGIIANNISDKFEGFFDLLVALFGQAAVVDTKSSTTFAES